MPASIPASILNQMFAPLGIPCDSDFRLDALTLPILPPLRAILNASSLGTGTWLETAFGKSYSAAGFGNTFKDWCNEADLPRCNCHGLRKIGAVRAAEAGASEHELMAMFGWENADMARVYTRKTA